MKGNRCIFITGSPEYGKTYTAISLLWEFYKNSNYIPRYIEEGSKELNDIISRLVNQDKSLQNNIIYIEDPVGKTEYTRNNVFEESIGSVMSGLGRLNTHLVVTMREEIYQKFNPIGKERIKQYVKKLNIANHSYDSKRRKEMLSRWATVMNCKWFQDEILRKVILQYIENDETKLPTPLNIKDCASETTDLTNMHILEKIDEISQRTPERFARDIKEMKRNGEIDKILFLCFPFISDWFFYDFIKSEYNKLAKDFKVQDCYAFEKICTKLQDKIEFSVSIRFSHPSYYEALPFLLLEDGVPTEFNTEFFSTVLFKLMDNKDAAEHVANAIAYNFNKMPERAQNLLFKMADNEDEDIASEVARGIGANLENVPEDVRNELLIKIGNRGDTTGNLTNAIANNFDKLPENIQNLLFKVADNVANNEVTAGIISYAVANNFDKLPERAQNLLFKMADNKNTASDVANAIADNFDRLPDIVKNELQKRLSKHG